MHHLLTAGSDQKFFPGFQAEEQNVFVTMNNLTILFILQQLRLETYEVFKYCNKEAASFIPFPFSSQKICKKVLEKKGFRPEIRETTAIFSFRDWTEAVFLIFDPRV